MLTIPALPNNFTRLKILLYIVFVSSFCLGCEKEDQLSIVNDELLGTYKGTCISETKRLDVDQGFKYEVDTFFNMTLELIDIRPAELDPTIGLIEVQGNCAWETYEFPMEQLQHDTIFGATYGTLQYVIEIEIDRPARSLKTYFLSAPSFGPRTETHGTFQRVD